ncbi:hypothetical protein FSARC_15059 [Fusarium sarcochroum]|uniref:Uncharacterized protein n=1 Tax=Fusarium sarcochroum TaxID=1208366 RepID=A0A8H4WKL7_9HYPO|nr:hypothetical protein FSARC_15059 [Fusarium sarcochroum]
MAPPFYQGSLITRRADSSENNVDNVNTDELAKWQIATLVCALVLFLFFVIAIVLSIKLCRRSHIVRNAEKCLEKATKYKNAYHTAQKEAAENQVLNESLTSEITRLREVNAIWAQSYHELFGDLSNNPTGQYPQGPPRNASQATRSTTRVTQPSRPQQRDSPRQPATPLSSGILRGTEFEHGGIDDGYFGPSNQDFTPLDLNDLANGAAANYVVNGRYIQPARVPIPQETRPTVRFEEPTSPVVSPHQKRLSSYWAPCRGK